MKYILNKAGFLVLGLNKEEINYLGFGVSDNKCLCDSCNKVIEGKHYYIGVLHHVQCEDCCRDFCDNHTHNIEDMEYEERNFLNVSSRLIAKNPQPMEFEDI